MQNLRDKLLKAGLVTADQVKNADKKPERKKDPPRPQRSEEERQRREAFAARDAEVAEQRKKELAKLQESRMQSERAHKLRALVQQHRITETGDTHFHYVKRSGKIGRLLVTAETAKLLEGGVAAVVEDPGQPDAVVVPSKAAEKFYAVDPKSIRFWAGPQKPVGFDDVGATEESEPAEQGGSEPG
jgi:uncharacterized protein YaiL (DUF2058 family)